MPSDTSAANDNGAERASATEARGDQPASRQHNIHIGGDVRGGNIIVGGNNNIVVEIAMFVGVALGSGIIGNAAYDTLKLSVKKLVRRSQNGTPHLGHERELLARAAVQKRCAEVDFPAPDLDAPCDVQWDTGPTGYTYRLTFRHVVAKVLIPKGPLEGQDLEVTLQSHADSYDLAQARLEVEQARRRRQGRSKT
ncbi:hypothetical protein SAMN05421504_112171 [Amycolatopsis xylanica]|uniref:Uncharacterized protein n=1 Tax=Amycolatopsis xylanica TaxID=589385 RepID=A0A1H3S2W0_9PSEU|nr:hypothetical protein [Amycolatopsis xylanica]SDZ31958.1 hypothetical protein SAMN05421504_112171 [Amycolatopsis xylanica]